MESGLYPAFFRRSLRNMMVGLLLSILPAGAFYFFVFPYTHWQLFVLGALGLVDLAAFLPLDIFILRRNLNPVRLAFEELEKATAAPPDPKLLSRGLGRLLDAPWWVIVRIYGPHSICASAGITLLVLAANRWIQLGIPPHTFVLYWLLNLTVVPLAHTVYEFTAMERATQPLARVLAESVRVTDAPALRLTLSTTMRVFFPLLVFAPIAVILTTVFVHAREHWGMTAAAAHLMRDLFFIGLASAVLLLYLMYQLGNQLRLYTTTLVKTLDRVGQGELGARAELFSTNEFGEIARHINEMAAGLSERQRLRDLFGAYMSNEVADALLAKGDSGDRTEKRYVAILFVDVRGFTAFSQRRSPEVVVSVLNKFFEAAVDAIAASGGTVNKYLGDGLLAIFGAPVALEQPGCAAVQAAAEISKRLRALNHLLEATGVPAMKIGIGIHAGEVVVGSIGSPKHKLEYTVIGDPVNVASRIEQLNKSMGTEILISEEVFRALPEPWRSLAGEPAHEQVKGIDQPVKVYPLSSR